MIHYRVVDGRTPEELEVSVRGLLMAGYQLVGGVSVSAVNDGEQTRRIYAQAVIFTEDHVEKT